MVGAAQRSQTSSVAAPVRPFRRLISISILMASIGLAGGLLLRILNPGSMAGFSGLGRVQDFPETDWPGETQLDDIPEDVPQPEYSGDRWDESGEELPDVIWDEEVVEEDVLALPEESWDASNPDSEDFPVPDYGEALDQAVEDSYREEAYYEGEYDNAPPSQEYADPYGGDAAVVSEDNDAFEAESGSSATPDEWSEEPWIEELPVDGQEAPRITADDFPQPDLPPAYEAPTPQSSRSEPAEGNALYGDLS